MHDVENFQEIFAGRSYSDGLVSDIQENQSFLGGHTFFERLLQLLKIRSLTTITGKKLYPPKTPAELSTLHNLITTAPISLHYKHCLIFYLLKDLSASAHQSPTLSDAFANDVHLEKRFRTFLEGIWDLDHLQFETAVQHLTHPSIIQTFPDEILLALLRRGERGEEENVGIRRAGDPLPLAYFNCAGPPLTDAKTRREFAKYLSARNVTESWYWIQTRPEHERKALLEILVETTLASSYSQSEKTGGGKVYPTMERAMELVGLPFGEEEEKWLETYLTEGKGRLLEGAGDTVLMRKLATGRLVEFAKDGTARGQRHEGLVWEMLRDGVRKGLGPREKEEGFSV
ncbi:hypothetical protein CC80DRAFT_471923 [Byssothecium circinans]|uniref:ELYS-like domain-containing protein n=1 Tax=Byssothecium circinans TaxID=147558 RepID=A0A6A5U5U6_9PLEO|nr:hypothetical protein CC80DRAFT_471923 [Byssothecium circinans]